MSIAKSDVDLLKNILENTNHPEQLDSHPWASSLFVKETVDRNPSLRAEKPGWQLIAALCELFSQMMPSTPPRHGKRLDNHWGEFGLLAARYFVPLQFGTAIPNTLRDTWGRIDSAILHCVYGKSADSLEEAQIKLYQLVGDDLEYSCASTLSDWHKKGLQRFTEFVLNREHFLSQNHIQPSIPTVDQAEIQAGTKRWFLSAMLLLFLLVIGFGILKVSKIYKRGALVYEDARQVQKLATGSVEIDTVKTALPKLRKLQTDLSAFQDESHLLLWLAPKLSWVPVYGNDLAAAPKLFELAGHLLNTSIDACQTAKPILDKLDDQATLDPADLTDLLLQAQPSLAQVRRELDQTLTVRKDINAASLSPTFRDAIVTRLDPLLKQSDEILSLGMVLPGILGASEQGPKTYLLLIENEDELRPTGGFITSIGNLVISRGQIISLDFEADEIQDDWSKPYPAAPWQLQEYMNSPVLILRDANWFTNFPTTALWAESLYAYTHSHSVDGVIAFDQHFLVMLLSQLGPLEVDGTTYPITSENVIEYMRDSKQPPAGQSIPADWNRKDFIGKIAAAMLKKLYAGNQDWQAIAETLYQALAERHLLLQFDDPTATALIAGHGWDNALRAGTGDFLMVTDTNIGFNKTNALVDVSLTYDIDLRNLNSPTGTLTLVHKNNAKPNVPCVQWDSGLIAGEEWYPIDRCYWSYVRVYRQEGVQLLQATPHAIPADWMILGEEVPARVDDLDEEIPGIKGYGTLLVIPGGGMLTTSFQFGLPQTVISAGQTANEFTYHLKVQKQPGTLAHPLTIRLHFPKQAGLEHTPPGAILQNNDMLLSTNLRTDVELEVLFTLPYRLSHN